jgi:DNA-directed RNA polymerase I subunit RPA49
MRDQRTVLGQEFGTKKARKAIQSLVENAISPDKSKRNLGKDGTTKIDAAHAAILANMAEATASMPTRESLQEATDAAKPRPKANLDTTDITKVYTIEELAGEGTMELIPVLQWQKSIKKRADVLSTSIFVGRRIPKHSTSVEKLKMLRYLQLLIDFYRILRPGKGSRFLPDRDDLKTLLGDIPEFVLDGVKKKFANGKEISKFGKDLLVTHICALALVIENFELDTWDLKEDLRMELSELTQFFNEVGAKKAAYPELARTQMKLDKATASQRRYMKLKFPLEFPKQGVGRKKR